MLALPFDECICLATPIKPIRRILVIAPHADDELIGCYQLLKDYSDLITVLYCSFLGSDYSEKNRIKRENEFLTFIRTVKCNYIISSPNRVKEDTQLFIKQNNPEFVFLPSVIDWQHEHRLLNYLCNEIINESSNLRIAWYHVSLPIPGDYVNAYSEMSELDNKEKWRMMEACYTSQLHMDIDRFRFVDWTIGNTKSAFETYCILKISNWKKLLIAAQSIQPELDNLKYCLGDMGKMFNQTKQAYMEAYKNEIR